MGGGGVNDKNKQHWTPTAWGQHIENTISSGETQCIAAVESEIQHSNNGDCFACFIGQRSFNERITGLYTHTYIHTPHVDGITPIFACQNAGMWQTKSLQNTKGCDTHRCLPLYSMMFLYPVQQFTSFKCFT